MPDSTAVEPPRLPLLLAAKEAVRLIRIAEDDLADDDRAARTVALLCVAARDLELAIALHEAGPTPQQALLVALADLHPDDIRGARRVLEIVGDSLARRRRRRS